MALNLGLEKGVKLSKKDKARLMKKIKQGWKATCLVPDYGFDESNNLILPKGGPWTGGKSKPAMQSLKPSAACWRRNATRISPFRKLSTPPISAAVPFMRISKPKTSYCDRCAPIFFTTSSTKTSPRRRTTIIRREAEASI